MYMNELINKSYENLLEAQDSIYELEMKMIKCEHVALINEDVVMLEEAENDFKSRIKEIIKKMVSKFLEFIEEVRVKWSKFMANIARRFLDEIVYREMIASVKEEEITAEIDISNITDIRKIFIDIMEMNWSDKEVSFEDKLKYLEGKENSTKEKPTKIDLEIIREAHEFLVWFESYTSQLNSFKTKVKEIAKKDIDNGNNSKNLMTSKYIHIINKLIIRTNKAAITAVKVCRACYHKPDKISKNIIHNDKAYRSAQNRMAKNASKAFSGKKTKYSKKDEYILGNYYKDEFINGDKRL